MFQISSHQKDKLISTIIEFINSEDQLTTTQVNKLVRYLNTHIKESMPASVGFFRGIPDDFIEVAMRRAKVEYSGTDTLSCVFNGDDNLLVYANKKWKEI